MKTNLFTIQPHYNKCIAVKSLHTITVCKGESHIQNNATYVSSMSLVCIQNSNDAELLFWTGDEAMIVAKAVFTGNAANVIVVIQKYFSPQKLKMLNCIKTRQQWDVAIASMKSYSKVHLHSVVMKITTWKGKLNVWFEVTTSVANPVAALYFKAARKNITDKKRFHHLINMMKYHAKKRPTMVHNASHFNHTQIPGISRHEWDLMTKGMKQILQAAKTPL